MSETTQSPSTIVSDSSLSGGAWNNPSYAGADDANSADATLTLSINNSQYLKATNFGFSVPADATINGIKLDFERYSLAARATDHTIRLIKGGSIVGNNKAGSTWPSSFAVDTKGGLSDMWGESWTPANINASDFGCVIAAVKTVNTYVYVDYISITVYYTPVAGADVIKQTRYYQMMRS